MAAVYSLLSFTLLPNSLNGVDKPGISLIRKRGKERKGKNAIVLVCIQVNVDVQLLCFRWNQERSMYDCTDRRREENITIVQVMIIYNISYTRMNTTGEICTGISKIGGV